MIRGLWRIGIVAPVALFWACDESHYNYTPARTDTIIGSGVVATEARPVAGFTAISVDHPARVVVVWGGAESLEVSAEDNVLPLVRSEVRNGRLFLSLAPNPGLTLSREIVHRVTVRELEELEASGAARVELHGASAESLSLRLTGASGVVADGRCDRLELNLSGASRSDTPGLRSLRVLAAVSGASHALLRVEDELVVNASGASVLEYFGDPLVTSTVSGASTVRRVGP
jgi:Putative auto-transporter adhesin, head GIN domain